MRHTLMLIILVIFPYLVRALPQDTVKNELYSWKLTNCFLVEPVAFDTLINEFHILNQVDRQSISNSSLGSIGNPWRSNLYEVRAEVPNDDFYFTQNYHLNLLNPDNQLYYHAKKPYFELSWTSAPKKRNENQLNLVFTQNINKNWNIGLRYRLISSGGEYPRALSSQHSWNLFTSYTGEKYSLHSAYVRNKIKANENGGIQDTLDPTFAKAFLDEASSMFYSRSFYISQQYKFGFTQKIIIDDTTTISNFKEAGRLNYIIRFDRNYRVYKDDQPKSGFYEDVYIDTLLTYDSLHMARYENTMYWSFKEINKENFKGRFTVGGTHELLKWSSIDESDSVFQTDKYHSLKLFGNLSAKTKSFIFNVDASYYLKGENGFKESDYSANGLISKAISIFGKRTNFYARLGYKLYSPDLYIQNYRSNHFRWENKNFSDVQTSNTRFGIEIPAVHIKSELFLGNVLNYIYFDSLAMPRQLDKSLNVLSVSLSKDFRFGLFSSDNKVVYQLPNSNSQLCLPEWTAYHSFYLDKYFEKVDIHLHLGYDLNFVSKYSTYGYMPATGVFYVPNKMITGNYAIFNAYIKLKIKTVLVFAKMEHINNMFLLDKYYFLMDKYPAGTAIFKWGVSWRFRN